MRYAIVGCGSRHAMFRDALTGPYSDRHTLVALLDSNPVRLRLSDRSAGEAVALYPAAEFGRMMDEARPDVVNVAVPDHLHAEYIVAALDAGADANSETPLAHDLSALPRRRRGLGGG